MKKIDLQKALTSIGLALHSSHNTVTTDLPDIEPNEKSWRIDNAKEIKLVEELESLLLKHKDICPLCGHHKMPL